MRSTNSISTKKQAFTFLRLSHCASSFLNQCGSISGCLRCSMRFFFFLMRIAKPFKLFFFSSVMCRSTTKTIVYVSAREYFSLWNLSVFQKAPHVCRTPRRTWVAPFYYCMTTSVSSRLMLAASHGRLAGVRHGGRENATSSFPVRHLEPS